MSAPIDLDGDHPMLLTRPKTRGECEGGFRPCPWVSCRYHLTIQTVGRYQTLRVLADPDIWMDTTPTCALDIADAGGMGATELAALLGMSRQGVSTAIHEAQAAARDAAPDLIDLITRDRRRPDLHWDDVAYIRPTSRARTAGTPTHTPHGRLRPEPEPSALDAARMHALTPSLKAAAAATARTLAPEEHAAALDLLNLQLTRRGHRPCS